jgi:glycosyltransferase involved in cell wall biosynthesis
MSTVDVIVPCYNYARFLRECVESVLAQSHRDLRVLIIDDASTDDTARVAADLAATDSRVAVRRHAGNRGHIAIFNEGIDAAAGDYMIILSADDYLLSGAVGRAVAVLDAEADVGMVHGACLRIPGPDRAPEPCRAVDTVDTLAFMEALAEANTVRTPTVFVRTMLQKTLGHYLPQLPHAGDLEMWLRFALRGRIAFVPVPQAVYRRHEANLSSRYGIAADLQQYFAAYRLHLDEIDARPGGQESVVRIRRILARRLRRGVGRALIGGHPRLLAGMVALWLREGRDFAAAGQGS